MAIGKATAPGGLIVIGVGEGGSCPIDSSSISRVNVKCAVSGGDVHIGARSIAVEVIERLCAYDGGKYLPPLHNKILKLTDVGSFR
jgi:hypothetical protein